MPKPIVKVLLTSENRKNFWFFQEVEKGHIGNKWVNIANRKKISRKISRSVALNTKFIHFDTTKFLIFAQ